MGLQLSAETIPTRRHKKQLSPGLKLDYSLSVKTHECFVCTVLSLNNVAVTFSFMEMPCMSQPYKAKLFVWDSKHDTASQ